MKFTSKGLHLFFTFALTIASAQSEIKKPNIIFLLADDQNTLSVGCYGNSEVQTPNMDKLGADGVIFDKHYNTTPICMASRASIMTGMYEYKTGTNFQHGDMTPKIWEKSYPILLREAGYLTAFAGKFGFQILEHGYDTKQFFDIWGGSPNQTEYKTAKNESMRKYAKDYPHSTLAYAAFGQDVIKTAVEQNKPFCLSISFKAPHRPVQPDPKFKDIYKGKTFTKPTNYGRENGKHLSAQSKQGRQYSRFTSWGYNKNYDQVMAKYFQQVYAIDVALGMIRKEIEDQGITENTVIIYTSDNGFICGSHGYGSKVLPMEESSRVPLIILDPRSDSAGKKLRTKSLTGNIDFAPTILELAGLPVPKNMDGVSLLPILEKTDSAVRDELAVMNTYGAAPTKNLTLITQEWKYTYWWYGDKQMTPAEELFNLNTDPLEMTNLANNDQYTSMLEEMQAKYDSQLKHWEKEGVSYNKYPKYVTLFDRSIPWEKK